MRFIFTVLLLMLSIPVARADSWDQVAKDATHSSSINGGPAPPLERAWVAKSGDSESSFTAWPVVKEGVAYAPSAGGLIAVQVASGKTLWWKDFGGSAQEAAVVDASHLYAPLGTSSMVALDRRTADVKWKLDEAKAGADDPSPTLWEGKLFFGQADTRLFYCLDANSGKVLWKVQTRLEPTYVAAASFGIVVLGAEDPNTSEVEYLAFEASNGKEIWRFRQTESSSSPSILGDKLVLGGGDFKAYALNVRTGQRLWTSSVEGKFDPRNLPAIAFGDVFLADRIGNLYRLDGDSGQRKWIFRETEGNMDQSFPIVAGRTVFAGSGSGGLYALNTENGHLEWKSGVKGIVLSGAADESGFYFGVKLGRDEGLHAYKTETKKASTRKETPSPSWMALVGGLLLFALAFGAVVLFARRGARSTQAK